MKRGAALLTALALAGGLATGAGAEEAKKEQPVLNPRVKQIL